MHLPLSLVALAALAAVHGASVAQSGVGACDGIPIRNVSIDAALAITPWAKAEAAKARDAIDAELRGKPYTRELVRAALAKLERYGFAALASDAQFDARFVKDTVSCADGVADLSVYVFAPRAFPYLKLGAAENGTTVHATVGIEYDPAEHLSATGAAYTLLTSGTSLSLDARKSSKAYLVALAVGHAVNTQTTVLTQAEWRIDYLQRLDPLQTVQLWNERLAAAGSLETQPLGAVGIPVYAAGSLEVGRYSSEPTEGNAGTATEKSGYRAAKFFVSAARRVNRTSWIASYGVEGGALEGSRGTNWTRQVVDVAVDSSVRMGKNSRLSFEGKLGGGTLRRDVGAPAGVSFVGGGREKLLMPLDSRSPRSAPLFRGLGSGELPTASRFAALNLTVGAPIFRTPVVPAALTSDDEFRTKLTGAFESAVSQRQSTYIAEDPHFLAAIALLPSARTALADLKSLVEGAKASWPIGSETLVAKCTEAIRIADRRARQAIEGKTGGARYGFVLELLEPGEPEETGEPTGELLRSVQKLCGGHLNASVSSANLAASVAQVDVATKEIASQVAAVDRAATRKKAEAELAHASESLNRILYEFDLLAVTPLLMGDVVRLNDRRTRRGIGVGLRLALVSTLELDLGYMSNRDRAPGESSGAFFLTFRFKDFF